MKLLLEFAEMAEVGYLGAAWLVAVLALISITQRPAALVMEAMNLLLAFSAVIGLVVYAVSIIGAFAGTDDFERFTAMNRYFGPYAYLLYLKIVVALLIPQVLWWPRARRHPIIALGIWLGILLIEVLGILEMAFREYLPSGLVMRFPDYGAGWLAYVATVAIVSLFLWRKQEPADLKGVG